ncbi:MAG TPA: penicillin-binding transpeptidase domain-containing protein [bacterium]|nr:penicillin-binding transpeptidase domain-containing protein [bacterium]
MKREKRIFGAIAAFVMIFFLIILYRLYDIQILRHEELDRYSSSSEIIKTIKARRGAIYDRNGEVLAISEPRVDLAVDPNGIKDKRGIAALLASAAGFDAEEVFRTLSRKGNFRYLKKDVGYETVRAIQQERETALVRLRELERKRGLDDANEHDRKRLAQLASDLNYVIFVDGFKRIYPQGKLLANVIGWVSQHDGEGLGGLELSFNKHLSGGEVKIRRLYIPGSGEGALEIEKEMGATQAGDLHLTIDAAIQAIAEEELDKMVEKTKAKWGGVVVMDPASGRILAMANNPSFLPEEYRRYPLEKRRNHTVSDLFEPGSTMKVFSILAAMNENLMRPGELVNGHNGVFKFGGRLIHDTHGKGLMTLEEVVVHSSNIGTVQIVDRLSSEKLYDYFGRFGFGKRSGLQLPGESTREVRNYKKWYPIDKANLSFGQGLSVNMVQMVRALSVLYNGGVLWQPTIVDRVIDPVGGRTLFETVPSLTRLEFKYTVDKKMIGMMDTVVAKGTALQAALKGVKVGGKTGTSQKYDPVKKKYSWDEVVCSFVGAVPSDNPKLVMMVVIDEPQGKEYGGTVAAPVFREIARRSLPFFGVYVEKDAKEITPIPEMAAEDMTAPIEGGIEGKEVSAVDVVVVPQLEGLGVSRAAYAVNQAGLDVVISGASSGVVKKQSPAAGEIVPYGTAVIIESEEEKEEPNPTEGGE